MKLFLVVALAVVATLACGRRSTLTTPVPYMPVATPRPTPVTWIVPTPLPTPTAWTEAEIQKESQGCLRTASYQQMLTSEEQQRTVSACRCIFEAAAKRWSYATYRSFPTYYLAELERVGIVSQCASSQ